MDSKKQFFLECYQLGILKFGDFKLKSGIISPFYVDLRPLASDPKILKKLAHWLLNLVPKESYDLICGVPYAALPMAAAMSLQSEIPLIIKRKEAKNYGTKKLIEGIYQSGQNCVVVEDVVTSGKSLLETLPEIEAEKINVTDIVAVLDREQGGKDLLEKKGYRVHLLFTITEIVGYLVEENLITSDHAKKIYDFVQGNTVEIAAKKRLNYTEKLALIKNNTAKNLLEIALKKSSNLIASADVTTTEKLLEFAEKCGPHIVALKTHIDILTDFDYDNTILPLKKIAEKHQFLLMEDRKFADIGNTQSLQLQQGIYRISDWTDLVTAQLIAGKDALTCFLKTPVVAILSMSSKGALTTETYFTEAEKIAVESENVIGGVAQVKINETLLHFTPGVHLESNEDGKGQQYHTPETVFKNINTDFIIVGRGIYQAEDISQAAIMYQKAGWIAYQKSLD